ncbi:MAG TPA: tetratricopeptide repeat protein [Mariprofundaceae bacterium]|nr:tetratricopeptide repeat protein [Mariprofundaceae bacterium]
MPKLLSILAAGMLLLAPLAAFAQSPDDLLNQAILDYNAQDYARAEKEFAQVLDREPGNLTAHYHLGMLLIQSDPKQALVHLQYVAQSPVHAPGIRAALAEAYQAAGMYEKALPLWRDLHAQHPENREYTFQYAVALQSEESNQEARRLYQGLVASGDPTYADLSRYQLGVMLADLGSYNLAAEQFGTIPKDSPYGKPARDYLESLAPVTRPLSIYLSGEYFYNDNPGAASSVYLGTAPTPSAASQGSTWIGRLSTRQLEFTPHWRARLSYLFYGTFYLQTDARQYDFVGHYLNPELSYHPNARTSLVIKGDLEHYEFSHQWLNDNAGLTLSAIWKYSPAHAYRVYASYLNKQYTDNYQGTSLRYLNADAYSLGLGTTAASASWHTKLSIDYTYTLERTNKNNDPVIGPASLDSRYREMAIQLKAELPVPGTSDRLTLLPDYKYAYRNYPHVQSGTLYTDIPGQYMQEKMTTWSVRLQAMLSRKYHLALAAGYEDNLSKAQTTILTYRYRRYFGRISAYY